MRIRIFFTANLLHAHKIPAYNPCIHLPFMKPDDGNFIQKKIKINLSELNVT